MEIDHGAIAEQAYTEFGGLLRNEVGTDLGQAWSAALVAKSELTSLPDKLAESLTAIRDNPLMTATAKAEAIRETSELFDIAANATVKKVEASVALVRSKLETAAISDLATPLEDAGQRSLIRDEGDRFIARRMSSKSKPGEPYVPGDSAQEALLNLVRLDPVRYGPEVAGSYGKSLLHATLGPKEAVDEHAKLVHLIQLSTPASTPRAQAARNALEALKSERINLVGQTGRLAVAVSQKLEKALHPPSDTDGPNRFWFDDINKAAKARRGN